ncbi:MAG: efflux RND transporter periplasmic adaptor subunit [Enterocloster sp.]
MKNRKKVILAVVVIAIVGIVISLFMRKDKVVEYETRPTVSAENPQKGDITLYTDLTGVIEPQSKASVQPKMGGEVLEVYFQSGDRVAAGQPLCKIDSDALTSLKLQVDAAEVTYRDASSSVNRLAPLYAQGFVSQQDMEQAQNGAEKARIAYESAKTQYELQLEYTTVTAPIDGLIESRTVDPHDHIGTSTVICTISGADALQVKFGITEKTLANLKVNDVITVEKNGTSYEGKVTEIGTMVNSGTGLYDVKAVIPQAQGLTNGTRVKLTVVMSRAEGALTVPVDAVSYDGGVPFVYCYEDGVAHRTVIESGIYDSEKMEVKSGLTADSLVINSWSNELMDGAEVILEGENRSSQESQDNQESSAAAEGETAQDGQVKING